jgi:hypothetical protein
MKLPNIRKIGITVIKRSENYDPPPEFYWMIVKLETDQV